MAMLIARVLLLATVVGVANTLCNTCSAQTGTACVSAKQFRICVDGIPSSVVMTCPTGTVCTSGSQICANEGTVQPTCAHCGVCNDTGAFACIGYNTFSLCYGSDVPDNETFTCAEPLVCYIDAPQICIDPTLSGIGATCPPATIATTSTTTTLSPSANPQAYCARMGTSGRFDLTSDVTCKGYILCAVVNNTWIGLFYQCPGNTYFNSSSELCETSVPERCALN